MIASVFPVRSASSSLARSGNRIPISRGSSEYRMVPSADQMAAAQYAEARNAAIRDATAQQAPAMRTGQTKVIPKDGLTYIWIQPGTFTMGCSPGDSECPPNEKPAHEVRITAGFWMGWQPATW